MVKFAIIDFFYFYFFKLVFWHLAAPPSVCPTTPWGALAPTLGTTALECGKVPSRVLFH